MNDQEMIEWYTAIRAAKLNRLAIAYPSAQMDEVQFSSMLLDFVLCDMLFVAVDY